MKDKFRKKAESEKRKILLTKKIKEILNEQEELTLRINEGKITKAEREFKTLGLIVWVKALKEDTVLKKQKIYSIVCEQDVYLHLN